MEISKENIFRKEYTGIFGQATIKRKSRLKKITGFIKNNKLISITLIVFLMFITLNFVLIYNFIKILENM